MMQNVIAPVATMRKRGRPGPAGLTPRHLHTRHFRTQGISTALRLRFNLPSHAERMLRQELLK